MTVELRVADLEREVGRLRRFILRLQGDHFANADRIQLRRFERGNVSDNDGYFFDAAAERFRLKQVPTVGGSPSNAQYLVLAFNPTLNSERRFVPGTALGGVDGGAGEDYTLNHIAVSSGDLHPEYTRRVTAADNVSSPPTDAELDTAFGEPSALGDGFVGLLDDAGAGTTVWLCVAMNSAWWFEQLTKAV